MRLGLYTIIYIYGYFVSDKVKVRNYGANLVLHFGSLQTYYNLVPVQKSIRNVCKKIMYIYIYIYIKSMLHKMHHPPKEMCRGHIYMHKQTCFGEKQADESKLIHERVSVTLNTVSLTSDDKVIARNLWPSRKTYNSLYENIEMPPNIYFKTHISWL